MPLVPRRADRLVLRRPGEHLASVGQEVDRLPGRKISASRPLSPLESRYRAICSDPVPRRPRISDSVCAVVWNRIGSCLVTLNPSHGPWSVSSVEMTGQFAARNRSTFAGAIV